MNLKLMGWLLIVMSTVLQTPWKVMLQITALVEVDWMRMCGFELNKLPLFAKMVQKGVRSSLERMCLRRWVSPSS